MSVPLIMTFVSTVAFAIQLLIFVYRSSLHRARFFQYAVDPAVPRLPSTAIRSSRSSGRSHSTACRRRAGAAVYASEVTRQNGDVALTVSETGQSIPPQNLRRVSEPFYSGTPNGRGLGLTIAQRIAGAHGGRIEVDSQPGHGPRVTRLIPVNGR